MLDPAAPIERGALVEPLHTVLNGQDQVAIQPGAAVLVLGLGPIGVLHVAVAQSAGASVLRGRSRPGPGRPGGRHPRSPTPWIGWTTAGRTAPARRSRWRRLRRRHRGGRRPGRGRDGHRDGRARRTGAGLRGPAGRCPDHRPGHERPALSPADRRRVRSAGRPTPSGAPRRGSSARRWTWTRSRPSGSAWIRRSRRSSAVARGRGLKTPCCDRPSPSRPPPRARGASRAGRAG